MSQLEDKIAAKRDAYAAAVERALEDPEGLSREPMPEDDESEEESEEEFEEEYAAPTRSQSRVTQATGRSIPPQISSAD